MISEKELLKEISGLIVFILLIILFWDFIISNSHTLRIIYLLFFINYIIILLHERKYKKNFPYKPYKSREGICKRILIGLLAGLHYLFFIGSYNHKRYNTQTRYPETIECIFGNVSQIIILILYGLIGINIFKIIGYYSLIFLVIPIITNIISIEINKINKKRKNGKKS